MAKARYPDFRYNDSGYPDLTAFEAINNVRREERKQLISELKALANKYGYRIVQ
ncbi:MAG: hypothetical protein IJN25_08445 [Clostridia bacterium]|nr:hypothetical protein [Clostridia bacterium]